MARNILRYRKLLLAERAKLLAGSNPEPNEVGPVNDEDWAAYSHDRFVALRLQNLDYQKLRLIDSALQRLASGEFGECIDCGKPISPKRLDVIPWASRCVECQELFTDADASREDSLVGSDRG